MDRRCNLTPRGRRPRLRDDGGAEIRNLTSNRDFNMPFLSPRRIERALARLAELAADEQLALELALCHGAVMVLAYADSQSRVVPARVVEPASRWESLVRIVALEKRLPGDWLREDVRYYLATFAARHRVDFDRFGPSLTLSVGEPGHVLAMKLHACEYVCPPEGKDLADVEFLIHKLDLNSWAAVSATYERFLPGCTPSSDVRARVLEMFLPPGRRLQFSSP
jgi:hypothetical protein